MNELEPSPDHVVDTPNFDNDLDDDLDDDEDDGEFLGAPTIPEWDNKD